MLDFTDISIVFSHDIQTNDFRNLINFKQELPV